LVAIQLPTLVVPAMAYATAASAEGKKCKCAHGNRNPYPVTAKPTHWGVPSVCGTVVAGAAINKIRRHASGARYRRPHSSLEKPWS
jgi:hypothetical protein